MNATLITAFLLALTHGPIMRMLLILWVIANHQCGRETQWILLSKIIPNIQMLSCLNAPYYSLLHNHPGLIMWILIVAPFVVFISWIILSTGLNQKMSGQHTMLSLLSLLSCSRRGKGPS